MYLVNLSPLWCCNQYKKFNIKCKMNSDIVKGSWNEQKGILKQRFAELTDDDFLFSEGKKDEMLGRLQVKLGKTKEEMETILKDL